MLCLICTILLPLPSLNGLIVAEIPAIPVELSSSPFSICKPPIPLIEALFESDLNQTSGFILNIVPDVSERPLVVPFKPFRDVPLDVLNDNSGEVVVEVDFKFKFPLTELDIFYYEK